MVNYECFYPKFQKFQTSPIIDIILEIPAIAIGKKK